jgi:hypothetical protein
MRVAVLAMRRGWPMSQLRTIGLRLALFGTIGGGILGWLRFGRRRKLTADDIDAMDDETFGRHIRSIGLKAQVEDALSRLDRGPR